MILTMKLETQPPLTSDERRNWIEALRNLADCLVRHEDETLSPDRQKQQLYFDGGNGDRQRLTRLLGGEKL